MSLGESMFGNKQKKSERLSERVYRVYMKKGTQHTTESLKNLYAKAEAYALEHDSVLFFDENKTYTKDDIGKLGLYFNKENILIEALLNQIENEEEFIGLSTKDGEWFARKQNPRGQYAEFVRYSTILEAYYRQAEKNAQKTNLILEIINDSNSILTRFDRGLLAAVINPEGELQAKGVIKNIYQAGTKFEILTKDRSIITFDCSPVGRKIRTVALIKYMN